MAATKDAFSAAEEIAQELSRVLPSGAAISTQALLEKLRAAIAPLSRLKSPEKPLRLLQLEHRLHFGEAALNWMQKQFAKSEQAGRLAVACEDALWARRQEKPAPDLSLASDAAWVLVSSLADGGNRAEALRFSRDVLKDLSRLKARLEHARARTELLFVAMLGTFADDAEHDLEPYRWLHEIIKTQVNDEPRTGNLAWQLAAFEAEHGDRTRALEHLKRAFTARPDLRAATKADRCFTRLYKDRQFVALTDPDKPLKELSNDPFVQQFDETAELIIESARSPERAFAAAFMADLLVEMNAGVLPVPLHLRGLSEHSKKERIRRGEKAHWEDAGQPFLIDFMVGLFRSLASQRTLFAGRAEALAQRLVQSTPTLFVPLSLMAEAEKNGWLEPMGILRRALKQHRPEFEDSTLPIGPAYLPLPSVAKGANGFYAEFYPSGHLKRAEVRIAGKGRGPVLALDEKPGSGDFRHQGEVGGSGFITAERYANGGVDGTFNSPWHDGEGYLQAIAWPLWVGQCLNTIAHYAQEQKV